MAEFGFALVDLTIALVHIGSRNTKLVVKNEAWLRQLNPEIRVVVCTDLPADFFPNVNRQNVIQLPERGHWNSITNSPHSINFRKGYWLHTLRRLAALADAHVSLGETKLLHIESDLLLLRGFPFEKISNLRLLTWIRNDATSDSPAMIFSPSIQNSIWLAEEVKIEAKSSPGMTDMKLLNSVSKKHPEQVQYFFGGELENKNDITFVEGNRISIFDAAPFGCYLTGTDPRNAWGISHFASDYLPNALANASKFNYCYSPEMGLEAFAGKTTFKIESLHIHSKNKKYFDPSQHDRLLFRAVTTGNLKVHSRSFVLRGFMAALQEFLRALIRKASKIIQIQPRVDS